MANDEDDPFGDPATEKRSTRSAAVVSEGKRQDIPAVVPLPSWPEYQDQDRGDKVDDDGNGHVDYKDLETVNTDLADLRVRQNFIRRKMREASRQEVEAKLKYYRQLRRQLVQQSGGSAETRKAMAELFVEELEADMVMKGQISEEWNTLFRSVRDDTENAKVVSYNLRALL